MSIIVRNNDFYNLRGPVPHGDEEYDAEEQETYDLRNRADVINYVQSDYGHQQIRDSKSGEHQYIEVPEKSGFIFIPNRDVNKATFIHLYKSPHSAKLKDMYAQGKYKSLTGKQLTTMAQVYMYTYNAIDEGYLADPKVQEMDTYKDMMVRTYNHGGTGLRVRREDTKADIENKVSNWVRSDAGQRWLLENDVIRQKTAYPQMWEGYDEDDSRLVIDEEDRTWNDETRAQYKKDLQAAERFFEKRTSENTKNWGFRRVTMNVMGEQVRGYHDLRRPPGHLTGTRLKVEKEVWGEIGKMVNPEQGQSSSGEKAYHYETAGRN